MPGYGADCGGLLELTDAWTHIASPNYPEQFREGQECSWLLVAPAKQRVQLNFFGEFEMYCKVRHSLCMDYVEIRNSTDFANTGMRYCCNGTPEAPVLSDTRDMLVLFRSFYRGGRGFQARARAIGAADGQPGDWKRNSRRPKSVPVSRARRSVPARSAKRRPRTRMEPCRRMCCAGYTLRRAADESEEEGEEDSADGATEREEICAK
uniref:CUB domain-containing protein n=1 Tax=Globodera rostochiensis TaxID=31243 RepID=A0A914HAF3_GLORO